MLSDGFSALIIFVLMFIYGRSREIQLSSRTVWNEKGVTVAGQANGTRGASIYHLNYPLDISITRNDVLYISDTDKHRIIVVHLDSSQIPFVIGSGPNNGINQFKSPHGLSITNTSLYVIDINNKRVQKRSLEGLSFTTAVNLTGKNKSFYLFVDHKNDMYVSNHDHHRVLLFQSGSMSASTKVAGTGIAGSDDDQLNHPYGIFVNNVGTMYVADAYNHRIMKWLSGAPFGIRVAGSGRPGDSLEQLSFPTQVLVDTSEYMYISEARNSRITRWAPHSTHGECITACTGEAGIGSTQIREPHSLAFDSKGSLYVNDRNNNRIQKFEIFHYTIPYNRPEISSNATWDVCGITIANQTVIGSNPRGIYVDSNSTLYVADNSNSQILIWPAGHIDPNKTLSVKLYEYSALFVNTNGDIYYGNGTETGRIDKWMIHSNTTELVAKFPGHCHDFFIDIYNNVYCSMHENHKVMKLSVDSGVTTAIVVAGTGTPGSEPTELSKPWGVFIDTKTNLYVADGDNNRIQLFRRGQRTGITVAGQGIPNGLQLSFPTDVVLDENGYLYIADNKNHRVIRSGHDEFKCIIGCTGKSGSSSKELDKPYGIVFDSVGNLYVADEKNNRIQKFGLSTNSCVNANQICSMIVTTTNKTEIANISSSSCDMLMPCKNNGTCENTNITESGYICWCPFDFVGTQCDISIHQWFRDTSSQISNTLQDCFAPVIKLVPSAPSFSSPLTFRRNQRIHLRPRIEVNCSQSLPMNIQWKIFNHSDAMEMNHSIDTAQNDLVVPGKSLPFGLYQIQLTVSIDELASSTSIYVAIVQPAVQVNLIEYDRSLISHGYREDLVLNPGKYSIDPETMTFNANNWKYLYYCRTDSNENCFSNSWNFDDVRNSSVVIPSGSLKLDVTYHLIVEIINKENTSLRFIGYLSVQIQNIQSPTIVISCIISTMCSSYDEGYYVNSDTQLALSSVCFGPCQSLVQTQWSVYVDSCNDTRQPIPIQSALFSGVNTQNLTIEKEFFEKSYVIWCIEVNYSSASGSHKAALNVKLNRGPKGGNCSIDPWNGTILTLFTINCSNWFDEDGVHDYSLYGWTNDTSNRWMIAHSIASIFHLRLSANIIHLVVSIEDTLGSRTECDLLSIAIHVDPPLISSFIKALEGSDNSHPILQVLNSADGYLVGQIVISLSQIFNELRVAGRNDRSPTSLSITPLDDHVLKLANKSDHAILADLNNFGNIREYLIMLVNTMPVKTPDDLKFQSSILSTLTQTTNQMSRKASVLASSKCHQLSLHLKSRVTKLSYEDALLISTHLLQCTTNVFSSINGVMNKRLDTFNSDLMNMDLQEEATKKISAQMNEIISSSTSIFNIHLNINKNVMINNTALFFSLEKLMLSSVFDRLNQTNVHFSGDRNQTVLFREILQPLALTVPSSHTEFSRSLSLSILDRNEIDLQIKTSSTKPIEFLIPRDPNLFIPPMTLQNVTLINDKNVLFSYHQVNLTVNNSIHFELRPSHSNLSYLFLYQFDQKPQPNAFDGLPTLFCPSKHLITNEDYVHFLDNNQTVNHQSVIYAIRELTSEEMEEFCVDHNAFNRTLLSITDRPMNFSSNYSVRVYQSGCYYLDSSNKWQSDGLVVGSKTNHYQTHCLSTHL